MSEGKPGLWKRIWDGLQGTELRLWHMLVVGVFSAAVPILVSYYEKRSELVVERSQELVEVSSEFENNVNRLVQSGETLGTLKPELLAALLLNVESQISALNRIRPVISSSEAPLAEQYARTLVEVRDMLQDGISPDEVRRFGIAAQKLVSTRDKLLAQLT